MRIQEEKGVMTERTGGLAGWLHRLADRQQQKRDSSPQRIASLCPLFPFSFFCYVLSFLTHPTALFPFFPSHCLSTAHPTFRTWPSTLPPFILSLSLSPFAQAGHSTRLTGGLRHWPLGMSKCLDRCQKKACLCVVVRECACAPCYAMTRSRLRVCTKQGRRRPFFSVLASGPQQQQQQKTKRKTCRHLDEESLFLTLCCHYFLLFLLPARSLTHIVLSFLLLFPYLILLILPSISPLAPTTRAKSTTTTTVLSLSSTPTAEHQCPTSFATCTVVWSSRLNLQPSTLLRLFTGLSKLSNNRKTRTCEAVSDKLQTKTSNVHRHLLLCYLFASPQSDARR